MEKTWLKMIFDCFDFCILTFALKKGCSNESAFFRDYCQAL
jgi:hypothetical protein